MATGVRAILMSAAIVAAGVAITSPAQAYTSRQIKDVDNFISACNYQGGTVSWRTDFSGNVTSVSCTSADGLSSRTYFL
jgi:hypothetical protein